MSNSVIDEARKRFQQRNEGKVNTVNAAFPPIVRIHNAEGTAGAFLSGVLDSTHVVKINNRDQTIYNLKLIETNAPIVTMKDKKMVDIAAKKEDIVSIFAPTRLNRVLQGIAKGTEVFIEYMGREKHVGRNGMATNPHMFNVKAAGEIVNTNASAGDKTTHDDDTDF